MGTRSLTRVNKNGSQIVCMYRQFDGYPSCHGVELFKFLDGMNIVNGFSGDEPEKSANGAGCLAAQLIANFKEEIGGIYIYPVATKDAGQDYEYIIDVNADLALTVQVIGYEGIEFSGSVEEFGVFCQTEKEEE